MIENTAHSLREEGNAAHDRGAIDEASAAFRRLLELYPSSNEAIDAVFYLTSGHRHAVSRPGRAGKSKNVS